jgi:hypothetical protein
VLHRLARPHPDQQVQALLQQVTPGDGIDLLAQRAQFPAGIAAEAGAEDQPPTRQAIEAHGLAGQLLGPAPGDGGHHRTEAQPLGRAGHGRERHPRVRDIGDRRPVQHVVPDEQPVPPGRLGLDGERGHEAGVRQLAEDGQEQGRTGNGVHGRRA